MAVAINGETRAEGALPLDRPLQEMYGDLYFPVPAQLERFLVPSGNTEIRLELYCERVSDRLFNDAKVLNLNAARRRRNIEVIEADPKVVRRIRVEEPLNGLPRTSLVDIALLFLGDPRAVFARALENAP